MLLLFVSFILPLACLPGPTCTGTCKRLYDPDKCGIERPGMSQDDLIEVCEDACYQAMAVPGDLDDYDPWTQSDRSTSVQLENRTQAEEWKECVAATSCEDLTDGYCAPVW